MDAETLAVLATALALLAILRLLRLVWLLLRLLERERYAHFRRSTLARPERKGRPVR